MKIRRDNKVLVAMSPCLIFVLVGLLIAFLLPGCGTTRKLANASSTTTATEQTITERTTEVVGQTSERTTEQATTETASERTTTTTETTITTDFSPPDSLGNQHKVRETTTTKQTEETERKGSAGQVQKDIEKTAIVAVADSLREETIVAAHQTASVVVEKELKAGAGTYLWPLGIIAVIGIGIWALRRV